MADFTPHAASPLALKALVLSLLVTSGLQAWQLVSGEESGAHVTATLPPAFFVNVTVPADEPAPAPEEPQAPAPAPEPFASPQPPPTPPQTVHQMEAPLYRYGIDFTMEALVSATPLTFTPWSGTGAPFVLVYYKGLNDTQMHHNAYLFYEGGTGYDLCDQSVIRFWDWLPVEPTEAGTQLLYQSQPLPENMMNLFGSGENCYTRALAQSTWQAEACMEGDGEIAKPSDEILADGTTVHHVDVMDYCAKINVKFP